MENQNKNWVLGRPLVFGDKEQIAELERIKKEKYHKESLIKDGMDMFFVDCTFKCYNCDSLLKFSLSDIAPFGNLIENKRLLCICKKCGYEYKIVNSSIKIDN